MAETDLVPVQSLSALDVNGDRRRSPIARNGAKDERVSAVLLRHEIEPQSLPDRLVLQKTGILDKPVEVEEQRVRWDLPRLVEGHGCVHVGATVTSTD